MMRCVVLGLLVAAALGTPSNDCGKPCDVMLVIDRSGSITKFKDPSGSPTGGEKEAKFAEDMVGMLDNHYKDLKIGFVSYNSRVYNTYAPMTLNVASVTAGLDKMPPTKGVTHTHKAIASGKSYLLKGARSNVACKRMYVITDGVTYPRSYAKSTQQQAAAARKAGIEVFAIGIGSGIKGNAKAEAEMRGIASDPDSKYFIEADDFDKAFQKMHQMDVCLPTVEQCVGLPAVYGGAGTWTCNKQWGKANHYNHTSACTLACPTGSTNSGDGKATCVNGTWSGMKDDKCSTPQCSGTPPPVTGGTWSCASPMTNGAVCNLTCQYGLRSGDGYAVCRAGKLLDSIKDVCDDVTCPAGSWSYQGSTYKFTSKKGSWTWAASEASNMGGYLASITSQAEQDWLNTNVLNKPKVKNHEYWFGLYAPQTTWMWSSGAPVGFTNFETGQNPANLQNHYGVINEQYSSSGNAGDLGKWTAEDNGIDPECGLVEIPPPVVCMCNTLPPKANPSQCAPAECSTKIASNVYSFLMCRFTFPTEFGTWTETKPNHYTSSLNAGYTCAPATGAMAASC